MELFKFVGANFRELWVFLFFFLNRGNVILWMRRVSVSIRKLIYSFKYVFVEDLNSRKRAIHECHENLATKKSNDSTMSGKEIPETFDV